MGSVLTSWVGEIIPPLAVPLKSYLSLPRLPKVTRSVDTHWGRLSLSSPKEDDTAPPKTHKGSTTMTPIGSIAPRIGCSLVWSLLLARGVMTPVTATKGRSGRDRQRGFTVLELLAVVTIIGILAALAIPEFQAYRRRGYEASAIQYMRSWVPAQEVYRQKNGAYADADEQLAQDGLNILFVPDDIPYSFSIDSNSVQTERWHGRGTPTTTGLRHFYIDQTGVVISSTSGPPAP